MRMRWLTIVMAAVLAGGGASPAAAQGKKGAPAGPRRAPVWPPRPQANRELDRFVKMPPEERQKELEKLPPQRRERMEQRLERYQQLTPAQREKLQQRYQKFQSLPPDRQEAVRSELQNLRGMRPAERKARLKSEDVKQKFSHEELKILREVSGEPEML